MKKLICLLSTLVILTAFQANFAYAAPKKSSEKVQEKRYDWKGFSMTYPTTWKIMQNETVKGIRMIRLEVKQPRPVIMVFSLLPKSSHLSEKYKAKPNLAAFSIAYPTFKKLLGGNTKNLMVMLNQIRIGRYMGYGAALMSPLSEKGRFVSAQSYIATRKQFTVMGMIMTEGKRGQLFTDKSYYKLVNSAYEVLRSIRINGK